MAVREDVGCVFEELRRRISGCGGAFAEGRVIGKHARQADMSVKALVVEWPARKVKVSVICGIDVRVQCSFWYGDMHFRRSEVSNGEESYRVLLSKWRDGLFDKEKIRATTVEVLICQEDEVKLYPYCALEEAWELISLAALPSSERLSSSSIE